VPRLRRWVVSPDPQPVIDFRASEHFTKALWESATAVLSNRALIAVAEARPTSPQALREVKGLGPKVLEQSGAQLIDLCRRA
jgi:hypothetical protein